MLLTVLDVLRLGRFNTPRTTPFYICYAVWDPFQAKLLSLGFICTRRGGSSAGPKSCTTHSFLLYIYIRIMYLPKNNTAALRPQPFCKPLARTVDWRV